jgi:hypothetical protein
MRRYEFVETIVLATWVIRSGNRHFENGLLFLYRLQTKEGKGKMGRCQSILML